MNRSTGVLWTLLGLLTTSLAGIAVYTAWPVLFPDVVAVSPLDPDCDLRAGPCTAVLPGGGGVSFEILPDEIPVLRPLGLNVRLEGMRAHGVEIDFAGTEMNMGYNRVPLRQGAPDLWQGQGMLPVCVRNRMEWEATVLLSTAEGLMAAPFRFETYRTQSAE